MIPVLLSDGLIERCKAYGDKVVDNYRNGRNAKSLAYDYRGIAFDPVTQMHGRACECAVALWARLDPLAALDWSDQNDYGSDLIIKGKRVDVKGTQHEHGHFLIWPVSKNGRLDDRAVDLFIMARGMPPVIELCGWIPKALFIELHCVSRGEFGLDPGTRFMHIDDIVPMDRSLAWLAIRLGRQSDYVMGRWT